VRHTAAWKGTRVAHGRSANAETGTERGGRGKHAVRGVAILSDSEILARQRGRRARTLDFRVRSNSAAIKLDPSFISFI